MPPMRPAIVVALLLALTACGGSPTATPKATATKTVTATSTPTSDLTVPMSKRESIFVDLVRKEHFPKQAGMSDAGILKLGHLICDAVPIGATQEESLSVLKLLLDGGYKAEDAGAMLAYSSALCPEKESSLTVG